MATKLLLIASAASRRPTTDEPEQESKKKTSLESLQNWETFLNDLILVKAKLLQKEPSRSPHRSPPKRAVVWSFLFPGSL